ncbi:putative phosphoglycerate mutase [Deinobacterium chartae]|uniref:Putative phosphoglycerate mutase n=1 Tax=Deinobacterium chartae TaxID=521158 RepID=A0A841HZM9_9DEIO|nr:histidine phosphatase family protein [Deinobacterium chartae]MBB6097195.1 putative phosphoglycerate mutase [Deinobacterium chartae]
MTHPVPRPPTGFPAEDPRTTTEFWVVRHAQTTWNAGGRYQGQTDVPLSDVGETQAWRLAERLEDAAFAAVYTSDLSRARRTAEIVASRLAGRPEVRVEPRLREIDVGELGGRYHHELETLYPAYLEELRRDPWNARRPGGESMADLALRVREAFEDLRARHPGERILVVTHGGVVRVAVSLALGGHLQDVWARLSIDNTSITRMLLSPAGGRLISYNDAAHLEWDEEDTPDDAED